MANQAYSAEQMRAMIKISNEASLEMSVQGLQETADGLEHALSALQPAGLFAAISRGLLRAFRYVSMIVHVLTGRLKNSLYPQMQQTTNEAYGVIGTNVIYAPYEHARGGSHAFFARTIKEDGDAIMAQIADDLARSLGG